MPYRLSAKELHRDPAPDRLSNRPDRTLRYSSASIGPLAKNAAHRFAQQHALCIYRSNAVYSFIPKNACSTLRLSIAHDNGCISSDQEIEWIHKNNATFQAALRDLLQAEYTFVVLRCPYRRIVSLFLNKIANDVEDNRLPALLAPRWRRAVVPVSRSRAQVTFRHFLRLLSRPNAIFQDHHWTPQVRFLVYKAYDDVFRVEALDQARRRLEERIGLELHDARALTRHGTERLRRTSTGMCADMPASELKAMRDEGYVPSYADFFDTETFDVCGRLYREDIELFAAHFGEDALLPREMTKG